MNRITRIPNTNYAVSDDIQNQINEIGKKVADVFRKKMEKKHGYLLDLEEVKNYICGEDTSQENLELCIIFKILEVVHNNFMNANN